jgi:hypothetical protein
MTAVNVLASPAATAAFAVAVIVIAAVKTPDVSAIRHHCYFYYCHGIDVVAVEVVVDDSGDSYLGGQPVAKDIHGATPTLDSSSCLPQ